MGIVDMSGKMMTQNREIIKCEDAYNRISYYLRIEINAFEKHFAKARKKIWEESKMKQIFLFIIVSFPFTLYIFQHSLHTYFVCCSPFLRSFIISHSYFSFSGIFEMLKCYDFTHESKMGI